jgi:hypothetical protein
MGFMNATHYAKANARFFLWKNEEVCLSYF